jgi:hypothetical protein
MTATARAVLVATALSAVSAWGDDTWAYTVQLSATVQSSPAQVTLSWPQDGYGVDRYVVFRKAKEAASWGAGTTLAGSSTTYVDNNVSRGAAYEYQVVKHATLGYKGYGYIYVGIEAPLVENRGKVILLVDSSQTTSLSTELSRLEQDLVGDGWNVLRADVSRSDAPANIRAMIQAAHRADPANANTVFLLGHVPIFRCGLLEVDEHTPRSFPADTFYGEVDAIWANPNNIPSDVDLMVGRVDLWNMPSAGRSETELLRNYLNKDHNWRHKRIEVPRRALMGNRAGDKAGEAPAASGFRNFEPFVGRGNTILANEQYDAPESERWGLMLAAGAYLWAYACGGGSYSSISFMGTHGEYRELWSTDIIAFDCKAVFFMMYGSWFGEWDTPDNIMRATLATPTTGLTCSYAGRPHWYYHHMGLGEPIGYSARLTQNNNGLYTNQVNRFQRGVHIALMGDPTLRLHPVAPPSDVRAVSVSSGVQVSWTRSPEMIAGYHVYRATSLLGPYSRRTASVSGDNTFTDVTGAGGPYTYMVRAIKLESTPSGTYYNPSQGAFSLPVVAGGGTRPTLTVSVVRTNNIRIVQLRWNSTAGSTYKVQRTATLTGSQWLDSGTVVASSSSSSWSETLTTERQRYYRIVLPAN